MTMESANLVRHFRSVFKEGTVDKCNGRVQEGHRSRCDATPCILFAKSRTEVGGGRELLPVERWVGKGFFLVEFRTPISTVWLACTEQDAPKILLRAWGLPRHPRSTATAVSYWCGFSRGNVGVAFRAMKKAAV